MTESMQKFKDIVDRTDTIALHIEKTGNVRAVLTSLLLQQAFLKLGKKPILDLKRLDERVKKCASELFNKDANLFDQNYSAKENILIKLNTKELPVSALRYENEGDILKIILESNNSNKIDPLNLKSVSVEKEKVPVDLLMLIDPPEAEINSLLLSSPHKDVINLTSKDRGLAVKTAEILETFFGIVSIEFKEALWFLAAEEEKIKNEPSKESLDLFLKLLDFKIDFSKIKSAKEIFHAPAFWKLFGRVLARSEFEKDIATTWAFLPASDFQKTGTDETVSLNLLEEMRYLRPEGNFSILLWEREPKSINAIISSNNRDQLIALAKLMEKEPLSYYFFVNGFSAFSEAELKIRGLIRKVL